MAFEKVPTLPEPPGLRHVGEPLDTARLAILCLHGRNGSAEDILRLCSPLARPGIAFLAPQAEGGSWYFGRFMAPASANEPALSVSLGRVGSILDWLEDKGFGADRVVVAGFSQGACLSLQYAARHPGRMAGVIAFTGGLIGPDAPSIAAARDMRDLPVFIGCREKDPFIPAFRVLETVSHLEERGADVDCRFYPGSDHVIDPDEIEAARRLLDRVLAR